MASPHIDNIGKQSLTGKLSIWRTPHVFSYWAPPILWVLTILLISGDLGSFQNTKGWPEWLLSWFIVLTPRQLMELNFYARKTGHALGYGVLYFLWFRAFQGHRGDSRLRAFLISLALCALVAVMDEGHQSWLVSRSGRLGDVILDVSGAGLGALFTYIVWTPRPKPSYMY